MWRHLRIIVAIACFLGAAAVVSPPVQAAAPPDPDRTIPATSPERCEVPVMWRALKQVSFDRKCRATKRERGELNLKPQLGKAGMMQLLIEWRIVADGKNKFKCTGFITYWYPDQYQDHLYSVRTKPGENLRAARLFVAPDGWDALETDTTGACE